MDLILNAMAWLTGQLRPYYSEASLMLMATLLVVYGDLINRHLKRMLSPYHFVVRTCVFVLVCAFGYGALTLFLAPKLLMLLLHVPSLYQGGVLVLCFILIGVLAEKRRYL